MATNAVGEELTQQGRDSLTTYLEDYVRAGFSDLNYAVQDLPGFIADPNPPTLAAAYPKAVLRGACRSYARGAGPQNLPGFDAAWGGLCEPYLSPLGENPDPGSLARPFTGGQCAGVSYTFVYQRRIQISGAWQWTNNISRTLTGPIALRKVAPQDVTCTESSGLKPANVGLFNGAGQLVDTILNQCVDIQPGYRVISVTRVGGGLDNCGSPPPIFDPPNPRPSLPAVPDTPVTIPGIGPVNIRVGFDPSGNLTVNLPDIGIEVPIENPFGGDDEPAPPPDGGPPPGDVGQPGAPTTIPPGGDAEGAAPAGSVLVGLRLQVVAFPSEPNRYTAEVYRGAYYVYMGVPGLLDHDPVGAMVTSDQFAFAEQPNLTAWRVRANDKWSIKVTPYYREVE